MKKGENSPLSDHEVHEYLKDRLKDYDFLMNTVQYFRLNPTIKKESCIPRSIFQNLPVYRLDGKGQRIIEVYKNAREAAKAFNGNHDYIVRAARKGKLAYGFRWKLEQDSQENTDQ